eukprot:1354157-Rhodomonas_salina.2
MGFIVSCEWKSLAGCETEEHDVASGSLLSGVKFEGKIRGNMIEDEDYAKSNPLAPPCITRIRLFRRVCEYSVPCRTVGKCGTSWGVGRRKILFTVAALVAFVAMIFTAVAVAGLTSDPTVLRNVYWAKGTGTTRKLVGGGIFERETSTRTVPSPLVQHMHDAFLFGTDNSRPGKTNKTSTRKWSDTACATPLCDECKSAAGAMDTGVIMAFITTIPTIQTDIQRLKPEWDLNCQKSLAMFVSGELRVRLFACISAA